MRYQSFLHKKSVKITLLRISFANTRPLVTAKYFTTTGYKKMQNNTYHILEIGYNGADVTDIKTSIICQSNTTRWLAEIIYRGLSSEQYNGRFVAIKGENDCVKIDQYSEGKLLNTQYALPTPLSNAAQKQTDESTKATATHQISDSAAH